MLEDTRRVVSLPSPDKRELHDLKKWLDSTGRLDPLEYSYLDEEDDLGNLTGSSDRAVKITENFVEDCVVQASELLGDVSEPRELELSAQYQLTLFSAHPVFQI